MWPYSKIDDERVKFLQKYITIKHNPNISDAYKIGVDTKLGEGYYVIDDVVFKKTFTYKNGNYPDGDACYECYLNDLFIEFETLSPLYKVKSGNVIEHTETFSLYKKPFDFDETDEKSVDKFLENI